MREGLGVLSAVREGVRILSAMREEGVMLGTARMRYRELRNQTELCRRNVHGCFLSRTWSNFAMYFCSPERGKVLIYTDPNIEVGAVKRREMWTIH